MRRPRRGSLRRWRGDEEVAHAGVEWYRIAYRRGHSPYNMAVEYARQGRWALARKWYERDLAQGEIGTGVDVALCMLTRRGARLDPKRAYVLVAAVVKLRPPNGVSIHSHEEAKALLGVLFARGIGVATDMRKARRWLTRANADGDYPEAACALANSVTVEPLDIARLPPWRSPKPLGERNSAKQIGKYLR